MRIVLLGHARIGVSELTGDHRHWHRPHGEQRAVGVTQDVKSDGRHDPCLQASATHKARLFGPLSNPVDRWRAAGFLSGKRRYLHLRHLLRALVRPCGRHGRHRLQ